MLNLSSIKEFNLYFISGTKSKNVLSKPQALKHIGSIKLWIIDTI